jgi:hypothetical protein
MKHSLTELTTILEELILGNGTTAVVNCLQEARDAMVAEWRRQAAAVSRAVQEIG